MSRMQKTCYLLERNPKLPFSQEVTLSKSADSFELVINGTIKSTPPELDINILEYEDEDINFQMHLRKNENRTVFYNGKKMRWPMYGDFSSLKDNDPFNIKISTKPRFGKYLVAYKIQVNDEPVIKFGGKNFYNSETKIIRIEGDDSTVISLVKFEVVCYDW